MKPILKFNLAGISFVISLMCLGSALALSIITPTLGSILTTFVFLGTSIAFFLKVLSDHKSTQRTKN
jgi:hypothetical protein